MSEGADIHDSWSIVIFTAVVAPMLLAAGGALWHAITGIRARGRDLMIATEKERIALQTAIAGAQPVEVKQALEMQFRMLKRADQKLEDCERRHENCETELTTIRRENDSVNARMAEYESRLIELSRQISGIASEHPRAP